MTRADPPSYTRPLELCIDQIWLFCPRTCKTKINKTVFLLFCRFFSAFAVLFISFWAAFHTLLPRLSIVCIKINIILHLKNYFVRSPTFGSLDNSFIKVDDPMDHNLLDKKSVFSYCCKTLLDFYEWYENMKTLPRSKHQAVSFSLWSPFCWCWWPGSSNAHGRVRLYNEFHQGHRDARIGEGIFSLFLFHKNGFNSSLKGVLPDLHLINGFGVHEPASWAGCIWHCWIGKGLLREWSESLYTSLS